MSSLSGFRKDAPPVRYGKAVTPAAKPPPDRDRCPAGWDADIWHLALLFEQYARADKIELRAGRPVIYAEISALVDRYGMREGRYRHEIRGCARRELPKDMADRCWFHWPPQETARQEARALTWVEMAEVILAEFWSRIWDAHALDHLRQHFGEYGTAAVEHWNSLRIVASIEDQPREPRQPVRRQRPGDTMADASKEG